MGFFVDFHLEKELLVTAWVANIKMNDVQPEVPTLTFQGEEREGCALEENKSQTALRASCFLHEQTVD